MTEAGSAAEAGHGEQLERPVTLDGLTRAVRTFSQERDWEQFQDLKSLALAMVGEMGEVAELLQWVREGDLTTHFSDTRRRARLGEELADVLIYLVRLADVAGVNLGEAAREKLARNRQRFPVDGEGSVRGVAPVKE